MIHDTHRLQRNSHTLEGISGTDTEGAKRNLTRGRREVEGEGRRKKMYLMSERFSQKRKIEPSKGWLVPGARVRMKDPLSLHNRVKISYSPHDIRTI